MSPTEQRDITIIGGGIIGCSTAYFLTRHPSYSPSTHRITLLEAASTNSGGRTQDSITDPGTLVDPDRAQKINPAHDGIAGGSSGKAGGLLAKWAFPANIVPLSFRLHDELAKEHDGAARWGYRRCYASQVECRARMPGGLAGKGAGEAGGHVADTTEGGVTKGLHKDHRRAISKLKKLGAPEDLDWLDTEESQRLLKYQRSSFDDIMRQLTRIVGYKRHLTALVSPIARWWLLLMSPYYRRSR